MWSGRFFWLGTGRIRRWFCLGLSLIPALPCLGGELEEGFRNPPPEAGIRCFWWWLNGNVTKEAITRDLEEMKAKGFSGALIFDADGSGQRGNQRVPAGPTFASREWTRLFVHACREADRLGLELSLNLQSGWNLGGPQVSEEDATQHLVWSKIEVEGGAAIKVVLERPQKGFFGDVAVIAVPLGADGERSEPIKNLALKSSTRELGMSAPDCRFLLETSPGAEGEPVVDPGAVLNLSERMTPDGTLTWDAPPGRWEVLRIGHAATGAHVSTHSEGWGGRVLDYLRPAALDRYWTRNIEPLMKAIGPLAGTTLKYVHTDSWEGGGMNWTPGFEKAFRKRRGYDPLPWLPVLAGHIVGSREETNAFLADFRKTIGDLVADHYGHLAELAVAHGMETHPECSGPHAGPLDGLKNYGRSSLMMSEFWSPSPHRPGPDQRFFVKQASSAAHTYGRRLVGAEGFTTIGPHWNDVPWSQMKPSFDRELCAGLNLLFVHTFTCSPPEMSIPGQEYFAGTHFNPQITWWDEAPVFIDYLRRCQFLAQRGEFVADVVHYYGDHVPNVFGNKAQDPAGALPGFDYDVLSEELLVSARTVEDGRLVLPSGMRYRVLSLPDHRVLSFAALRRIDELVRAGATVLGPKPLKAVSLEGEPTEFHKLADGLWGGAGGVRKLGRGRVVDGMTAAELLQADGIVPDVQWKTVTGGADIDWIHLRIGEAEVYFLAELGGRACETDFLFRVDGRVPELWNPVDGSIRDATMFRIADGRTNVPLRLDPYDSLFVVFRQATETVVRDEGPNETRWEGVQRIGGSWQVEFDPEWGGPGSALVFNQLIDWTEHPDPAVRDYSGKAVYRTSFGYDGREAGTLALELGDVRGVGIAKVRLNGTDLGVAWRPPFRFEVGGAIQEGVNRLEIEVVSSWHNRVLADSVLPEGERVTRTNIRVERKGRFAWKPEPSGLIGPVKLVAGR